MNANVITLPTVKSPLNLVMPCFKDHVNVVLSLKCSTNALAITSEKIIASNPCRTVFLNAAIRCRSTGFEYGMNADVITFET